jgi:8-oxo-dGTP diphosphatase
MDEKIDFVGTKIALLLENKILVWEKGFPAMHDEKLTALFMVAKIEQSDIDNISFGSEGQKWDLIDLDCFLKMEDVVPQIKNRLSAYLESVK